MAKDEVIKEVKKLEQAINKTANTMIQQTNRIDNELKSITSVSHESGEKIEKAIQNTSKRTWHDWIAIVLSIISFLVSFGAAVLAYCTFDLSRNNFALDIQLDYSKLDLDEEPYKFFFQYSQGEVRSAYYAIIQNGKIQYQPIEKEAMIGRSFEINLDGVKDAISKEGTIQFAIILFDNNGRATIKYFAKLFFPELSGLIAKYDLYDNDGTLVDTTKRSQDMNIFEVDCGLVNVETIQRELEDEINRTKIMYDGYTLTYRGPDAETIYSYICQIKNDCK